MGRKKQRAHEDKNEASKASPLEPAWTSSPRRNARYGLTCINHDSDRQYVINSYGLYAIRKIYDALTDGHTVEPSKLEPSRVMCFGDIDIRSDEMPQILAHKYTKAEEAWDLPSPYPEQIASFLNGPRMSRELQHRDDGTPKPVREKIERKPRIDRSQFITVQSIAADIGIDPRDARAALRKAKIDKPIGGWLGDETWAKGIRDILAKAAKELKKKGK